MSNPPDILQKILLQKAQHIARCQQAVSLVELQQRIATLPAPRGFYAALAAKRRQGIPAIIAEIKRASPSKGILRQDFQPAQIALDYAAHGAACLSVLTDVEFFQGSDADLQQVRQHVALPIIRKDFVIDPYQIYEARALGADAILLIAAALSENQLQDLFKLAQSLQLDVLVEIHNEAELIKVKPLAAALIGINNRDLHTFNVELETTLNLLPLIDKNTLVVTESGIQTHQDIIKLQQAGVAGFLIGENFMRAASPGKKLAELLQG